MKATGIVRRIDDLGRIVIPIEIRRQMKIRDGDPLEIFVEKDGEVILKKYSVLADLSEFGREIVNSLHEATGHIAILVDRDEVVAVAGVEERQYAGFGIGQVVLEAMDQRERRQYGPGHHDHEGSILESHGTDCIFQSEIVVPIVVAGDPIGAFIVASTDESAILGEMEVKLTETAAGFLARHMEE